MEELHRRLILAGAGLAGVAGLSRLAKAGPLDPPVGPITPTGKTLQRIDDRIARTDAGFAEPRIPVQSLPGSASAVHVITQPGSYYLTENISGEPGKNGIEIRADSVSLDLSGHALIGNGGLSGVTSPLSFGAFRVFNGSASGWSEWGIDLQGAIANGYLSAIENIIVSESGGGIRVRLGRVRECTVWGCATNGIEGVTSVIESCFAGSNANVGIQAGFTSAVHRCNAVANGTGVYVYVNASAIDCVVEGDFGTGISAGSQCLVRGNQIRRCERGILVFHDGTSVQANNINDALTYGLLVTGSGNIVTGNTIRSAASPLSIAAGNSHGPIVPVAGVGDISAVPGADHPWANFVY